MTAAIRVTGNSAQAPIAEAGHTILRRIAASASRYLARRAFDAAAEMGRGFAPKRLLHTGPFFRTIPVSAAPIAKFGRAGICFQHDGQTDRELTRWRAHLSIRATPQLLLPTRLHAERALVDGRAQQVGAARFGVIVAGCAFASVTGRSADSFILCQHASFVRCA